MTRVLTVVLFALYLILCSAVATTAGAVPYIVRFKNPGTTIAYSQIEITLQGVTPIVRTINCPAGMTCNVTIGLAPGVYKGTFAVAGSAAGLKSAPSNTIDISIPQPTPCTFDFDRSGTLTTKDFAKFLPDYENGYWTTADFSLFVSRFGKTCQP